jgi:hypothetical protein
VYCDTAVGLIKLSALYECGLFMLMLRTNNTILKLCFQHLSSQALNVPFIYRIMINSAAVGLCYLVAVALE